MRSLIFIISIMALFSGCTRTIIQESGYKVPLFPIEYYEEPKDLEIEFFIDDEEGTIIMTQEEYFNKLKPYVIELKENHRLLIREVTKFNEMNLKNQSNIKEDNE